MRHKNNLVGVSGVDGHGWQDRLRSRRARDRHLVAFNENTQ